MAIFVCGDEYKKHEKARLDADPGNAEAIEELVTVEGLVNTNWDTKGDAYVNDVLNVSMEDVRVLVKKALERCDTEMESCGKNGGRLST